MAYFTDTAGSNSLTSLGFYSALPASEQSFFEGGTFYYNDLNGDNGQYDFGLNFPSGVGLPTTGGPTYPGGFVAADLAQHPGIAWIHASTAGTGGWFTTIQVNTFNHGFTIWPGTPTTTFRYIFNAAKVLSTAADRFVVDIGPFCVPLGPFATTGAQNCGAYIRYRDDVNGGNWVYFETFNDGIVGSANSSVPFTANTWNRLEMTFMPNNNVLVTITPCGTTNTQVIYSGPSPSLQGGNPIETTLAAMSMVFITQTSLALVGPVMDYYSITVATTGRQW